MTVLVERPRTTPFGERRMSLHLSGSDRLVNQQILDQRISVKKFLSNIAQRLAPRTVKNLRRLNRAGSGA